MTSPILIVGGGIAAAAAAITLQSLNRDAVVIAPEDTGEDRIGETLSASANPVLQELGVWDAFKACAFPPLHTTFSNWGTGRTAEQRQARYGPAGTLLDRRRFTAMLWHQATAHERITGHVHRVADEGRELHLRDGRTLNAEAVIDCSGRSGVVARTQTKRERLDQLIAVYAFLEQVEPDIQPTPAVMTEAVTNGWWYSSLLPDDRLCVAYFTDADLAPRDLTRDPTAWRDLVQTGPDTLRRIQTAGFAVTGCPRITEAGSLRAIDVGGPGWVAAGDAAMAFDPLSSHGITTALWSGNKAAHIAAALTEDNPAPLRDYADTLQIAWDQYCRQRTAVYAAERRFPNSAFWQRRSEPSGPRPPVHRSVAERR
ncbi:MAG: tryptophan 7-halogenase [Acidobacteriota bacterium]|nr:tryptophan 7-halogenase [Acidobacteriota bacterium]